MFLGDIIWTRLVGLAEQAIYACLALVAVVAVLLAAATLLCLTATAAAVTARSVAGYRGRRRRPAARAAQRSGSRPVAHGGRSRHVAAPSGPR